MKQINLTVENAIEMYNSGIESLKTLALNNYSLREMFPPKKPKWEDLITISGWFVNIDSSIGGGTAYVADLECRNIFPTREEAEACLALSQLCQWRDKYNEGWKPNWSDDEHKYVIFFYGGIVETTVVWRAQYTLAFKTPQIKNKFLEDFRELIEIAKPLL